MPTAAMRPCATANCPNIVPSGHCQDHARHRGRLRRTSRVLTYAELFWRRWRDVYIGLLLEHGIVPVCGATLTTGQRMDLSQCQRDGLMTAESSRGSLHLHHEPALSEAEMTDRAVICDENRIVLLCDRCHNAVYPSRVC